MRHAVSLFFVLLAVWLVWSGHYVPLLVTLGGVSCLAVVAVSRRMRLVDSEGAPLGLPHRFLLYLPFLVWEIVKANLDVARRILDPRLPIQPHVFRYRATQRTDLGRVIHANSITLTPGTVSIGLAGDEIVVHALTREAARGVESGEMDRRVTKLEGRG